MTLRVVASLLITPTLGLVLAAPPKTPDFQSTVQPFLAKNCLACHNGKLKSGELDLQFHSTADKALKDRNVWEMVVQKIRSGEMPPKGVPKPKVAEIDQVTGWIEAEYERIDRAAKPDPGRVTARRLNRYEYNNTIRDLLGSRLPSRRRFPRGRFRLRLRQHRRCALAVAGADGEVSVRRREDCPPRDRDRAAAVSSDTNPDSRREPRDGRAPESRAASARRRGSDARADGAPCSPPVSRPKASTRSASRWAAFDQTKPIW